MKGTFVFLGTSGSAGVPMIGCKCSVCASHSPRNQRLRPSGLIKIAGKTLLIDSGPDFRQQALKFSIDHLDGFLMTHTHFDHIAGIDDLRIFYVRTHKPVPCLLSPDSLEELKKRYAYFFQPPQKDSALSAQLDYHILPKDRGEIDFLGIEIQYCSFFQGTMKVTGFRIGDLAYISDIRDYEDSIFSMLKGVRHLILSALKPESTPFHLSFDEAIAFANRSQAQHTWLTHLGHFIDHEAGNALLPPSVRVAYDGLELEFEWKN